MILKATANTKAEDLADFGVLQILGALLDGNINSTQPLDGQFIKAITTAPSKLDRIKQAICNTCGINVITTLHGKQRQLQDIYRKPGIQTAEGDYYSGEEMQPELYLYRLGTREEAEALGLECTAGPSKVMTKQSSPNPQPVATVTPSYTKVQSQLTAISPSPTASPKADPERVTEIEKKLAEEREARLRSEAKLEEMQRQMKKLLSKNNPSLDQDISAEVDGGDQAQVRAVAKSQTQSSSASTKSSMI